MLGAQHGRGATGGPDAAVGRARYCEGMSAASWWPHLDADTQHWLKHHHNEALTEEVLDAVIAAGGEPEGEFTPGGVQTEPDRYDLSQEDWHWIRDEG